MTKITRETLRRDADRRARERAEIADDYDRCADSLESLRDEPLLAQIEHRAIRRGVDLLRREAESWRR